MNTTLIAIITVVPVLAIMILVHEWGHFVAAKSFGVRVEIFSIGFGTRLWGRKRGDTDYRISALPLGGYVKMAGDNPAEELSGAPDEFQSKPRWQRAIIALAGPTMNILMAVLLMAGLYMYGAPYRLLDAQPMLIAAVLPDSPAGKAGIQPGDRIIKLGATSSPTWRQGITEMFMQAPEGSIPVDIQRGDKHLALKVAPVPLGKTQDVYGMVFNFAGFPSDPVIVGRVSPGGPGDRSGLKSGDQILSVNGQPAVCPEYVRDQIQENGGKPLDLVVERDSARVSLHLTPEMGDRGDGVKAWLIGMTFDFATATKSYGPAEAFGQSMWFNVRLTQAIVDLVGRLVTGRASLKSVGGPVEIARQSGQAARQGLGPLLQLMAIISLNLGILNLLPIPILDGGHLLLLGVEGTLRRDLSLTIKERIVQVGFLFLLMVFVFVMYNDIVRLLPIGR